MLRMIKTCKVRGSPSSSASASYQSTWLRRPSRSAGARRSPGHQAQGKLPLPNVLTDAGLRHRPIWPLPAEADVDAMGRVLLFARRLAVLFQDGVHYRPNAWPFSLWYRLPHRDCANQRLPNQPPMHTQFPSDPWIDPTPNSDSRRISSNNSTVALLLRTLPPPPDSLR
jgi:hypothetical protein